MSKKTLAALLLASVGCFLAACGGAEVGEACETEGNADECVDGAICGKPDSTSTTPQCLKVCTSDAECTGGTTCNGVTGTSTKACRVK